ncbi:hypothetical protein UNDYM_2303 [Undibacterium sp. YM2]|nr:hypothetical protein UNDYM_2303 [Undibacterium sp. YM2]
MSHRSPIYYVDLTVREGMSLEAAIATARETDQRRRDSGYDQVALDTAAALGFAKGAFEESEEEAQGIVEEFYPEQNRPEATASQEISPSEKQLPALVRPKPSLVDKLDKKLSLQNPTSLQKSS